MELYEQIYFMNLEPFRLDLTVWFVQGICQKIYNKDRKKRLEVMRDGASKNKLHRSW